MIKAEVSGTSIWGGSGPTRYAVYKIDVQYQDKIYSIYRRYHEFFQLHQMLTQSNPAKMAALQELFPEKGAMGSLINSFEPVLTERMHAFQRYLQALLKLDGVLTLQFVQNFFDISNLGISGFRKAIGAPNILKETYLEFSWPTFDFLNLHIWSSHYVGLTKRGYLYVFTTLYDDLSNAIVTIDLRTIDIRITGDVNTLVICLTNPTNKIYLKYLTIDEFSSWLRQISDFGVNAASQTIPSHAVERLNSTGERRPSTNMNNSTTIGRNSKISQGPSGGGGTGGGAGTGGGGGGGKDEFSDMFGM